MMELLAAGGREHGAGPGGGVARRGRARRAERAARVRAAASGLALRDADAEELPR